MVGGNYDKGSLSVQVIPVLMANICMVLSSLQRAFIFISLRLYFSHSIL